MDENWFQISFQISYNPDSSRPYRASLSDDMVTWSEGTTVWEAIAELCNEISEAEQAEAD